jgi:hypothetical protein
MANKKLTSLRSDVVPYLVARQGQSNSYLRANVPGLAHRRRPLQELESWRVNLRAITPSQLLLPFDTNTSIPTELSTTPGALAENPDLLRCFAVVVDRDAVVAPGNKGPICQRMATLQTYLHLNRSASELTFSSLIIASPFPCLSSFPTLLPEIYLCRNLLKSFATHCVVINGHR